MVDVLDSYFMGVKAQMANVDATQKFGGIVSARDWPQTKPVEGALYLMFLAASSSIGTASQPLYEYLCQWAWVLLGVDIGASQQAANRGDRHRANFRIMANLRQANFPQYRQKQAYTANTEGTVVGADVLSTYPATNYESVFWSRLRFMPQSNIESGVVYGAAAVSVYGYSDVLDSLAA